MNKAFIFDLDGVLINNEPIWEDVKKVMFKDLFGEKIYNQLGSTIGLNIEAIHRKASELGAQTSLIDLYKTLQKEAISIYHDTPITPGIQELGKKLLTYNYALGIVSASPKPWMELVINRLDFFNNIKVIISLDERKDLPHKPSPAGYLEAIKRLDSKPEMTIILEDSNTGIQAAKASGGYVIGLRQNLIKGYVQQGADIYADTIEEVINLVLARQ